MCGIFGIWHTDGSTIDVDGLTRATNRLRHRGPDDEGYFLANPRSKTGVHCGGADTVGALHLPAVGDFRGKDFNLGLGFRRLSILDLSPLGHQPMTSADGRFTLMLNGEIYNYVELREELSASGHVFRSRSDSEVLLTAYAAWGRDVLKRLVGMFAFVIYDRDASSLFLARDFFGIKPLYFASGPGRFAFASEIPALLELPWVGRRVQAQRLYDYLRFGLTDDGSTTMFADIRQIPAGGCLEIRADSPRDIQPTTYYRVDADRPLDISFDEAAVRIRELFLDNVRLHLRSDVPVGACLSGGIDSSAIVMAMRRLEPSINLHAFSYCADDPAVGEESWVDLVGGESQCTVHKVRLDADRLIADLNRLIEIQAEPFGSTSIYAQHAVFRLAQQAGIKVMLDGQGADELLAGYRPYLAARAASLLRRGHFGSFWKFVTSAARLPGVSRRELHQQVAGLVLPAGMQSILRAMVRRDRVPSWLDRHWFAERGVSFDLLWHSRSRDVLREKLHETFTRTSLPMLLRFEDRNSMAYSVESRVPFLTPLLVEFVSALPEEYLIASDGTSKAVFRAALRGLVPDAVLDRRDKIGFATPERDWLVRLQPWVDETLGGDASRRVPVLRFDEVRREWQAVIAGRTRFDFRFWRWINLVAWVRRFDVSFAIKV